jgi:putative membrane protein
MSPHPPAAPVPGQAPAAAPAAPPDPAPQPPPAQTAGAPGALRSRAGAAWVAACAATLLAVALIIFMIQNTRTVEVTFLGMTGRTSLAIMLLIAAVGGILLTLVLGSARILQLRRAVRRRARR